MFNKEQNSVKSFKHSARWVIIAVLILSMSGAMISCMP